MAGGTTLVLDLDGVVNRSDPFGPMPWHRDLEADWGFTHEKLAAGFFRVGFQDVLRGRRDLFAALGEYFETIGLGDRVAAFVSYWFDRDRLIDEDLLRLVRAWSARTGGRVYLATNQEHHRVEYLRQTGALGEGIAEVIYSAALGVCKPDRVFFTNAQQRMGVNTARSIAFFDDSAANVDGARACGWRAYLYRERRQIEQFLDADG
ncbi:MAG: HAD-IA family hydrolase [Alphaproteobacteria bacterium]|nr:HAD-IA family hydrolase [Alphaproteobacteria bacterium]